MEEFDANKLAKEIRAHASESKKEEDLKIRVEVLLEPIRKKLGISWASYENRHQISGQRKDALYGTVIIEYKSPGKLESKSDFEKSKEQVKKYIVEEAKDREHYGRYFGVILDGFKIAFVRFRKHEWEEQEEPFEVNSQTILRLLEALRGLKRKPVDAEFLLSDFGPKSETTRKVILVLYESLTHTKSPRTLMLFNDWKRVFSQVCAYSPDKLKGLIAYYGLKSQEDIDVEKLLFATHTYYTILMKLLTSEIVTLFADSLLGSYLQKIEEAYYKDGPEMLNELKELEEGGIFATVGIRNFLEADYFAWYLDDWSKKIASSIFDITQKLLDYEPATVELNPERVKDLFKRLYQNLVPRDIRHKLGEYFTPDWLAELVLNESGYDGNPDKKILDPACGSGTFLVLAIRRIKEYSEDHFLDRRELIAKVIGNVKGIDLNPLAVLASKANYLIALSDLLRYRPKEGIEIPIYLADSIAVERKGEWKWETGRKEENFELHTTEGKFWMPREVIDKDSLNSVLNTIKFCVKNQYSEKEFEKLVTKETPLTKHSLSSLLKLYEKIYKLEYAHRKNKIWAALLKNSFAPLLMGKFDYVLGNPPWINWETLPQRYRDNTRHLWDHYGLLKGSQGGIKRDLAMLFVVRCLSLYLEGEGVLSFLVPSTIFKSKTGAGFRQHLANKSRILRIHDLVELYPFEGATNRTALLSLRHGATTFPVASTMWLNPSKSVINEETDLKYVRENTKQFEMITTPIVANKPETSWMEISKKAYKVVKKVLKPSDYRAYAGTFTGMDSIYIVRKRSKPQGNLVLVENLAKTSKTTVKKITKQVEESLVHPVLRGKDAKRWYFKPALYIIVPHTEDTGLVIEKTELKTSYPYTYDFLNSFKATLAQRTIKPFLGEKKTSLPFYVLDNIGDRTFSKYKVAWKHISGKIAGRGVLEAFVISPYENENAIVPTHGLMFIPSGDYDEANFLCGVLNSSIAHLIVMTYALEVHITTDVPKYVFLPKFDPNNSNHKKISQLSIEAHQLAKKYHEQKDLSALKKMEAIQQRIDDAVSALYRITDEELEEIKKSLRVLEKGSSLE